MNRFSLSDFDPKRAFFVDPFQRQKKLKKKRTPQIKILCFVFCLLSVKKKVKTA